MNGNACQWSLSDLKIFPALTGRLPRKCLAQIPRGERIKNGAITIITAAINTMIDELHKVEALENLEVMQHYPILAVMHYLQAH
jgi:hypothetical protein